MNKTEQQGSGTQDDVQQADRDQIEKDARRMGWAPKETWRGHPDHWIDADAYVKKGLEIQPILQENNKRLLAELRSSQAEIGNLKGTLKEFGELYKSVTESAYSRAITDVKRQIREAKKEDNDDLVESLEGQLENLQEGKKEVKVPQVPDTPQGGGRAIYDSWKDENTWYDKQTNPRLFHLTEGIAMDLSAQHPNLRGTRQLLDMVTEEVRRVDPDSFRRKHTSPVDGSSSTQSGAVANGGSLKRSYNNLPTDAKQQCDRFAREFVGKGKGYETVDQWRTQYCENYSWD